MPLIEYSAGIARELEQDAWTVVEDGQEIPEQGNVVVSPTRAQSLDIGREGRIGLLFRPDDEAEAHADLVRRAPFIAVDFPKFTDGRGYSTASVLRGRMGYEGPLRATGDVLPDQVFYLARVGFDQLELRSDKSAHTAIEALSAFSVRYQASTDGPPLFRQRR